MEVGFDCNASVSAEIGKVLLSHKKVQSNKPELRRTSKPRVENRRSKTELFGKKSKQNEAVAMNKDKKINNVKQKSSKSSFHQRKQAVEPNSHQQVCKLKRSSFVLSISFM